MAEKASNALSECRVLVICPPATPTYFNAGHRLCAFTVAAYLRRQRYVAKVQVVDAAALNYTWRDIAQLLVNNTYDVIALANDYGTPEPVKRFVRWARALAPSAKLITFGRLSKDIPNFFRRYDLDAIASSGDDEATVGAFVQSIAEGTAAPVPGALRRAGSHWSGGGSGILLNPDQWPFPDIGDIPYNDYDRLYADDDRKFCGVPNRRELVVPVARGCPVQCTFCEVPRQQGRRERRRSVTSVINYIENCFRGSSFEYVSFYAPTFTLDRGWVEEFCCNLIEREKNWPWKCVTTIFHLDDRLVNLMARAGCKRISVGLETLDEPGQRNLPKIKRVMNAALLSLGRACRENEIELTCFVILGLPGQTLAAARETMDAVIALGGRVRPTIYSPYHLLTDYSTEDEVTDCDRLFLEGNESQCFDGEEDLSGWYRLAFASGLTPTEVTERIPKRGKGL